MSVSAWLPRYRLLVTFGGAVDALAAPIRLPSPGTGRWQRLLRAGVAVAVVVFPPLVVIKGGMGLAMLMIGAVVAVAAVAWAARYPAAALGVTIVYVPLQVVLLAYLYKLGWPTVIIKDLGYVKEAMVAGIALAAIRRHREWRPPDILDFAVFVYVGIATTYFLLPIVAPGTLGGLSTFLRLSAWRVDCLFMVLFAACRRLRWSPEAVARLQVAVVFVGVVMAASAIWELLAQHSYNHFFTVTVPVPLYRIIVLHVKDVLVYSVVVHGTVGGSTFTRAGGLFFDNLELSFVMLLPLGVALERLSRERLRAAWLIAAGLSAFALVLTLTRSAVLGGFIALLLAPTLKAGAGGQGRKRLAFVLVLAMLAVSPLFATSTLRHRFGSLLGTSSSSSSQAAQDNAGHKQGIEQGLEVVSSRPQGLGLGINPATRGRYDLGLGINPATRTAAQARNLVTTEDSYLQIGAELGLVPMLAFMGLFAGVLVRLRRRARAPEDREPMSGLAGGMWLAGLALAVTGVFLHVWISFSVALTFWGLAGIAVGQGRGRAASAERSSSISSDHGRQRLAAAGSPSSS